MSVYCQCSRKSVFVSVCASVCVREGVCEFTNNTSLSCVCGCGVCMYVGV